MNKNRKMVVIPYTTYTQLLKRTKSTDVHENVEGANKTEGVADESASLKVNESGHEKNKKTDVVERGKEIEKNKEETVRVHDIVNDVLDLPDPPATYFENIVNHVGRNKVERGGAKKLQTSKSASNGKKWIKLS